METADTEEDFWQYVEDFVYILDGEPTKYQINALQTMLDNFPQPDPGGSTADWHQHVLRHTLLVWLGSLLQPPEGNSAVFARRLVRYRSLPV